MLKVVEALAKERYDFKIETSPSGTWDITINGDGVKHMLHIPVASILIIQT